MGLSIRNVLVGLSLLLTALIAAVGLLSSSSINAIQDRLIEVDEKWLPSVAAVHALDTAIAEYRIAESANILSSTPEQMEAANAGITAADAKLSRSRAIVEALISTPEERAAYDRFATEWNDYQGLHAQMVQLTETYRVEDASLFFKGEMADAYAVMTATLADLIRYNSDGSADAFAVSAGVHAAAIWRNYAMTAVGTLIGLAAIVFIVLRVTRPVGVLSATISQIADGRFDAAVEGTARGDEIGAMARAVDGFRGKLAEAERMRREQAEHDALAARRAREERLKIADDLKTRVGGLADAFLASSQRVSGAATNLSRTAEQTSHEAESVSLAAGEAATSIQTVAASAEELAASVQEINGQVVHSANVADTAFREAESANRHISTLAEAAGAIGDVVNLIKGIADQTNLLALNATIEAARAGEAGRGFAVVAQEVKQLASQTARATGEISAKIGEMQLATDTAVGSITEIVRTIADVKEIAAAIAGAVEEQGAATAEIAGNTSLAAHGANRVTGNIGNVGKSAERTGEASGELMELSGSLSAQAEDLRRAVEGFVADLRSA